MVNHTCRRQEATATRQSQRASAAHWRVDSAGTCAWQRSPAAHVSVALRHWAISSGFSLRGWVEESAPPCSPRRETLMSTLFSGCSLSDVRTSRAGGSLAAMAPATRSSGACISREARGRGQGDGEGRTGRRAHSSSSFVRPGGSAHRRSTESPSSRAWLMIGDDWAGRAYHPKWSRT